MTTNAQANGKLEPSEEELTVKRQKLEELIADGVSAARSLEEEVKLQESATEEVRSVLEQRQRKASASLEEASRIVASLTKPSVLWGEVVRDIAQLGDGRGNDELFKALQESSAICDSFIGQGGDEELLKRIDGVIEMLGG